MRTLALVAVMLVGLMAVPAQAPMSAMDAAPAVLSAGDVSCMQSECSSRSMPMVCVTVCLSVVALLAGVAVASRLAVNGRVSALRRLFVDQLSGPLFFRPPRSA